MVTLPTSKLKEVNPDHGKTIAAHIFFGIVYYFLLAINFFQLGLFSWNKEQSETDVENPIKGNLLLIAQKARVDIDDAEK